MPRSPSNAIGSVLAALFGIGALIAPSAASAEDCSYAETPNFGSPAATLVNLSSDSSVVATFCGGAAGYTSETWLDNTDTLIGVGHQTPSGQTVDLGMFTAGTELVFFIYVRDTGYTFFSGPATRNPDGVVHAAVDEVEPGLFRIGFEDLYGGGDQDYDDINLVVSAAAELIPDTDGDGIPDDQDLCPTAYFPYSPDGCDADTDGDGIGDSVDQCPGQPDDANGNGRPDCHELVNDVAWSVVGTATGQCYDQISGTWTYPEVPWSAQVTLAAGSAPYYSYGYSYPGYSYGYDQYASIVTHNVQIDSQSFFFDSSDYHYLLIYDQDNSGYSYDYLLEESSDSLTGAYVYWYVYGGADFVPISRDPAMVNPSSFTSSYFYFTQTTDGIACTYYGSVTSASQGSSDADGDGVTDTDDLCPGFDDHLDADGDGTADGCDSCPLDTFNDSDGDGSCDSADPCVFDPDNDIDSDGICADMEIPGCALDPDNDFDLDGVCAPTDICPADPQNDADGDGLCADVDLWDDCSDLFDIDQDGTPDDCDVCPLDYYNDSDGDGACDSDDICPFDNPDDSDFDGSCDSDDICPFDPDDDIDQDAVCGDVDPCPIDPENDADGDGVCEVIDNCATVFNPNQSNIDGDSFGDACEPDNDSDTVVDDFDNCPFTANANQADWDHDGQGDACDGDDDNDGVNDSLDACPGTLSGPVLFSNGCSLDQTCPTTASWKNHGAYVSCVSRTASALKNQGSITSCQKDALVSAAARSSVGNTRSCREVEAERSEREHRDSDRDEHDSDRNH